MEDDGHRHKRFHTDFEKLRKNRENVPLQQLQTKYARSYNTLVAEVIDGADWFYRKYNAEAADFPTYPQDEAGNKWLKDMIAAIEADEKKPGGLVEQFHAALIERLDIEEYYNLITQSYERRLQAFSRYWQRHCKRLESGWIYNRIFKKFWWPKTEGYPESGCWINSDYSGKDYRYPPQLKEETQ